MDKYDEQANQIAEKYFPGFDPTWAHLRDDIAAALRQAVAVPEGCVRLADNMVVAVGDLVFTHLPLHARALRGVIGVVVARVDRAGIHCYGEIDGKNTLPYRPENCYATRAAAEAARKEVPRVLAIDEAKPTLPQMEQAMGQVKEEAGNG